jgi:hypothetical protein
VHDARGQQGVAASRTDSRNTATRFREADCKSRGAGPPIGVRQQNLWNYCSPVLPDEIALLHVWLDSNQHSRRFVIIDVHTFKVAGTDSVQTGRPFWMSSAPPTTIIDLGMIELT